MYIPKRGSTMKQMAYARKLFGAQGETKKQIALDVGYSPAVANSISSHIESKAGFNNAMAALAVDSNNLALEAMSEFKARGFKKFSNKELIGALNAIGTAWSKFNVQAKDPHNPSPAGNKLRNVILQRVENQTIVAPSETSAPAEKIASESPSVPVEDHIQSSSEAVDNPDDVIDVEEADDPMDF